MINQTLTLVEPEFIGTRILSVESYQKLLENAVEHQKWFMDICKNIDDFNVREDPSLISLLIYLEISLITLERKIFLAKAEVKKINSIPTASKNYKKEL